MKPNKIVRRKGYIEVWLNNRMNKPKYFAKVDTADWPILSVCSWSYTDTTGRAQGFVNGHVTTMHQFLIGKKEGFVIDHINHDPLDNRRKNLRYATKSQNAMNQAKVIGVTLDRRRDLKKCWKMQIVAEGKRHCSYHYTKKEALAARRQAEKDLFGEYVFRAKHT